MLQRFVVASKRPTEVAACLVELGELEIGLPNLRICLEVLACHGLLIQRNGVTGFSPLVCDVTETDERSSRRLDISCRAKLHFSSVEVVGGKTLMTESHSVRGVA